MPVVDLLVTVPIIKTARTIQLAGLFDIPPQDRSERTWSVDLPIEADDWKIGLIIGPSGSGKTTLARKAFGNELVTDYIWPDDKSVVDGFAPGLGIQDITAALSSVGFSTPPAWLRPYRCLSNGEQFRATLARALLDTNPLIAIDEFTSVVDRTVAKIGSAAVAKAIRAKSGKRFVAVTCHSDVEDWLCPDWVVEMPSGEFSRRSLRRRPAIELEIRRVHRSAWKLFQHHHYLDTKLHIAAKCFAAFWKDRAVAFASVMCTPSKVSYWREHRTVCLPDFQGVGIGNALSEFVAGVMKSTGRQYRSSTGNPAMIRYRAKSPNWRMTREPSLVKNRAMTNSKGNAKSGTYKAANNRLTAGFEYVGPRRIDDAKMLGII